MKNLTSFSNFANVCLRFLKWRHRAVQNRNFIFLLLLCPNQADHIYSLHTNLLNTWLTKLWFFFLSRWRSFGGEWNGFARDVTFGGDFGIQEYQTRKGRFTHCKERPGYQEVSWTEYSEHSCIVYFLVPFGFSRFYDWSGWSELRLWSFATFPTDFIPTTPSGLGHCRFGYLSIALWLYYLYICGGWQCLVGT